MADVVDMAYVTAVVVIVIVMALVLVVVVLDVVMISMMVVVVLIHCHSMMCGTVKMRFRVASVLVLLSSW